MPHTQNIRDLLQSPPSASLVSAYLTLIAIELALKDGGHLAGNQGHDVPAMLNKVANDAAAAGQFHASAQLASVEAQLRTDLAGLSCTGKNGNPMTVPVHSYPYARYTRMPGDWGGVSESSSLAISTLQATAQNVVHVLRAVASPFGVHL